MKELTVSEISKLLGYDVKIVPEPPKEPQYMFVTSNKLPYNGQVYYNISELDFDFGVVQFDQDIKAEIVCIQNNFHITIIDVDGVVLDVFSFDDLKKSFHKGLVDGKFLRDFNTDENFEGEEIDLLIR